MSQVMGVFWLMLLMFAEFIWIIITTIAYILDLPVKIIHYLKKRMKHEST